MNLFFDLLKMNDFKKLIIENTKLPTIITKHDGLTVIRDDVIFGGTKMRAIIQLIEKYKKEGFNKFVYIGPVTGFACVAISLASYALDCSSYFWSSKYNLTEKPLQQILIEKIPNAHLTIIDGYGDKLKQPAYDFVDKTHKDAKLLSIGNMTTFYPDMLKKSIVNNDVYLATGNEQVSMVRKNPSAISQLKKLDMKFYELPVNKLYLVATNAAVYHIVSGIFDKAEIVITQVSPKIHNKYPIDYSRTTIKKAPQRFSDKTDKMPPWNSVATYDAKSYQFIDPTENAYVYNIASDQTLLDILDMIDEYEL